MPHPATGARLGSGSDIGGRGPADPPKCGRSSPVRMRSQVRQAETVDLAKPTHESRRLPCWSHGASLVVMSRLALILALIASLAQAALGNVPAAVSLCMGSSHPDGHHAVAESSAAPAVVGTCGTGCEHDESGPAPTGMRLVTGGSGGEHSDCCCVDVELDSERSTAPSREELKLMDPGVLFPAGPVIAVDPAATLHAALEMYRGPPETVTRHSGDAAIRRRLVILETTRLLI